MWFKEYKKIHRLWKEEVDWILDREVVIQEKIDWANTSIWIEDWVLQMWSRTQVVYDWKIIKTFRWFQEYVLQHEWILKLLKEHQTYRLFWERLVRHTIVYPVEHYQKFYMFDIMDWDTMIDPMIVVEIANKYGINSPKVFWVGRFTLDEIMKHVGENIRWVAWEWVVIKSLDFVNKYWECCYAKIVHEQFKEENSIVFWNHAKTDIEMKFIVEYITPNRVKKIVNKIEQDEWRDLIIQDTPRVLSTVLYDAFTEEMWWYSWNKIIDMWRLKQLSNKRARFIFHKYLDIWEFIQWFDAISLEPNNNNNG